MREYHGEHFVGQNMSAWDLRGHRYEDYRFERCDLPKVDLGGAHLARCTFVDCDLTMVKLAGTALQELQFSGCRLLGLDLSVCKPMLFSASFIDRRLDHALLSGPSLKGRHFQRCSLRGADLTGCDLREAVFLACDVQDAVIERCDLRGADLATAHSFRIEPALNRLAGARFSVAGALSLLAKYDVVVE